MEFNLIKDEGGLDLHPNKTVICPKNKYRETLLNVNSKDFKTKDGKKNRTIRQKPLNKLTSKTPLEPEASSSTINNFLPEDDLDTESSDDHNELGYYGDDEERLPEYETVLNVKSNNFQEDGKNGTICQKTLNKLTNKAPLVEPEAPPSTIKTISPEEDLDTEYLDDHCSELERLPESETVLNVKSNNFQTEDGKNGTICQKTLNKLTNRTPLVEPEAPTSTIKTFSSEDDLDIESLDDHSSEVERLPEYSDSEESDRAGSKGRRRRGRVFRIHKEEPISRERRLAILLGEHIFDEIDALLKSTR